jgi:hypothetical protein
MDIDPIEEVEMAYYGSTQTEPSGRTYWAVIVDDGHPFDLDAYIAGYSGKLLWATLMVAVGS